MSDDVPKAEDRLNKALTESGQPLGGDINTDGDPLFQEMMESADQFIESADQVYNEANDLREENEILKEALREIAKPKVGPDFDWSEEEKNKWRAGWYRKYEKIASSALKRVKKK